MPNEQTTETPVPRASGNAELLIQFANRALDTMEAHQEWGSDTLDEIAEHAYELELGGTSTESDFIRIPLAEIPQTREAWLAFIMGDMEPAPLTLCEAIDGFPILKGHRVGTKSNSTRTWLDEPERFIEIAAMRGSGAHRCAQIVASMAGFQVHNFTLARAVEKLDSEHREAATRVLARFFMKGGF